MDDIENFVGCDGFKNWLKTTVALTITTKGIEDYVNNILQKLYADLQSACASLPSCGSNCSQAKGVPTSMWCATCKKWKNEITKHFHGSSNTKKQIKFDRSQSKKWPSDVNEVITIFVPDWWGGSPITSDFSTALSFCYNCSDCKIPRTLLSTVKTVRNDTFHEVGNMAEDKMYISICKLEALLGDLNISCTESAKIALSQLKLLKKSDVFDIISQGTNRRARQSLIVLRDEIRNVVFDETISTNIAPDSIAKVSLQICKMQFILGDEEREKKWFNFPLKWCIPNILILIFIMVAVWLAPGPEDPLQLSSCFATKVSFPVESSVTFQNYLEDQRPLVGRSWLLKELEIKLLNSDRGILLTAEMGYGKSAIVSHIACLDPLSPGYMIRERLIGLHICQCDIADTTLPEHFIMNLAGTFARVIQGYHDILQKDENAKVYMKEGLKRCSENPIGCFDALLRYPLKKMEKEINSSDIWFVVIDGLDECKSNYGKRDIYSLLSARIDQLASFTKVLLTSRNLQSIILDFPAFENWNLDSKDKRNMADIKNMIHLTSEKTLAWYNIFGYSNWNIDSIAEAVEGNFFIVTSIIDHRSKLPDAPFSMISGSLEKFFLMNLKRVFGENGETFLNARGIFEILCTAISPLEEKMLIDIIQFTQGSSTYDAMVMIGSKLGHFIVRRKNTITLSHNILSEFLTIKSRSCSPFFISKEAGHLKFSNYIVSELNKNVSVTFSKFKVTDIVTHLANSGNTEAISSFLSKKTLIKEFFTFEKLKDEPLLHYCARELNSYIGMEILINVVGKDYVDHRNERGENALFISAVYGYVESMKALLDFGANIHFRMNSPREDTLMYDPVSFCKSQGFCGYNLLHITAQNGHTKAVNELLCRDTTLMYELNGMGLNPFQLAAEYGHTDIMQILLDQNSSFADQHSLYYASMNGHIGAVKLLLDYN